ncbi:trigger factor, partial [Ruminococcus bicirculans (ex Wegman et al. 2014)]|uniref:trigger factor n=2 Tax=Ruminococcus TaxID=1263 RepID=UPI0040276EE8
KNIAMPGFRKGKAPRKLIEKEYGEQVFFEDAVNLLYAPVVNGAVEESGLELVTRPEVEVTEISKENGVKLKATCITKPEVEVKDYKGIEVEKVVNPVTDEDINKQLDALREKNVTVETVDDRAAENGDDVVIDFEGFKDDVAFEGGKAEDFTLSLGSGQFIPGFEDQIVGHNAGEDFDINVTFPEEYQVKELAGAPAVFKIKLKSISKKVMPELDDDMVKDSTEFDTVDEYKADVKKKLEEANEKHADSEVEAKIFDKVIENMTAEIPQVMFDNRVNEMIGELEQRLAPQGISLDLYMQYTGQTIDTVKKAYAEQAEKQVKLRLALEKIAKLENIEVTEDELKAEFDKLAEAYKLDVDQIKQFIHDDDLKKDIAVGKAVDLIKDAAVIK